MSNLYKRLYSILFLFIVMCGFACLSFAETGNNSYQATFDSKFIPSSDAKSQSGDLSIFEGHLRFMSEFKIIDEIPVKASIGANHYIIEDDISSINLPDALKSRNISIHSHLPIPNNDFDQFSIGIGVNPSFQTARGGGS